MFIDAFSFEDVTMQLQGVRADFGAPLILRSNSSPIGMNVEFQIGDGFANGYRITQFKVNKSGYYIITLDYMSTGTPCNIRPLTNREIVYAYLKIPNTPERNTSQRPPTIKCRGGTQPKFSILHLGRSLVTTRLWISAGTIIQVGISNPAAEFIREVNFEPVEFTMTQIQVTFALYN